MALFERQRQVFEKFVVVDLEATCEANVRIDPQEIIEFAAVLVDAATGRTLSEFRTYVRPRHNPRLTDYCIELTGIQQHQVNDGVDLHGALARHEAWLRAAVGPWSWNNGSSFVVVTWGDWDCRTMLELDCRSNNVRKPDYFNRWANLRVHFEAAFGRGLGPRRNLQEAVRDAGLRWEGRLHSGLDDARNTARLLAELMRRGVVITVTGSLPPPPQTATFYCHCGVARRGGVIPAPGPFQGRRFYCCGNWTPELGARCPFFLWSD